jgi:tetratricopeptide (TPR) repeat protein
MKSVLLVLIIQASVFSAAAQKRTPDELHRMVNNVVFSDPEMAHKLAKEELSKSKPNSPDFVVAQIDVAKCLYYSDNYAEGENLLSKALQTATRINFPEGVAWASFHLGDLRILEGKYGSAIQYLNKSHTLFEKQNNKEGEALSLNAIGLIYLDQEDFQKAQTFFKDALKTGDAVTHGDSYTNLAQLYLQMEAYPKARQYAALANKQAILNEDDFVKSTALDVLGSVAVKYGRFLEAEQYFKDAIRIKERLLDQKGASYSYLKLAGVKGELEQTDSLYIFTLKAFRLANEVGANKETKDAAFALSKYYAHLGFYDSAFHYQNQFVQLNEDLMNEQVQKKMAQIESEKVTRENEHHIAILENQKKLENEQASFYLLLAIGGAIVLAGGLYLFYYRYNVKKRSFESLEQKNQVIEGQNHNILESIRYAQRLQEAILPNNEVLKSHFKDIFSLYLPKDIVAGDFYWFEKLGNHRILACCDSTGHGVPGAMVSVVCSNALNRAVIEMNITDPGQILDETRLKVIESLNKSNSGANNVKDGMDISLISINDVTNEILFAGAHHTLWVYRNETKEFDFYKGDKQPIGIFDMNRKYTSQKITYLSGDRIFMFTDGYADQFGGPNLKKLKSPAVKNYLLSIQNTPVNEQAQLLNAYFSEWKMNEEQVDDVTVLGVQL